jgi:hypothetical protein
VVTSTSATSKLSDPRIATGVTPRLDGLIGPVALPGWMSTPTLKPGSSRCHEACCPWANTPASPSDETQRSSPRTWLE